MNKVEQRGTKTHSNEMGPWLWWRWQSGRFRIQRSADLIPASATDIFLLYNLSDNCNLFGKDEIKSKEDRVGPL